VRRSCVDKSARWPHSHRHGRIREMGDAGKPAKELKHIEGVRPASESSIEIDFYYKHVRCRERLKLKPTPQNLNFAAKLKARIEHEINTGEFDYRKHFPDSRKARLFATVPGDNLTIEDYIKTWLEQEKSKVRSSTWLGYKQVVNCYIIPVFGELALTELKR